MRVDGDAPRRECAEPLPKRNVPVAKQDCLPSEPFCGDSESVEERRPDYAAAQRIAARECVEEATTLLPTLAAPSPLIEPVPLPSVAELIQELCEDVTFR